MALRDHRLACNPARRVKLPRKVCREHVYLTYQQVHALAANAGNNSTMVLLLATAVCAGARRPALRVRGRSVAQRRISVVNNAVEVGSKIIVGTPKRHRSSAPVIVTEGSSLRLAEATSGRGVIPLN